MIIHENKKARFDYKIESELVAGIKLEGWEVKSIKQKQVALTASHAFIRDGVVQLVGMKIDPLKTISTHVVPQPERTRELLLRKEEIKKLIGQLDEKGYTLVPLSVFLAHGLIKVKLGVAVGKKLHDKREAIKERDTERDVARQLKEQ